MGKLMKRYLHGFALICAVLAPMMMFVEVWMDLQQPTLMSKIVDKGVAVHNLDFVLATGERMALFALIGFLGGASCTVLSSIASVKMCEQLRQGMFHQIQRFSFEDIDRFKTSSLITRLTNDVAQVQNLVLLMLRIIVRSPIFCIGGIVMSIFLIPKLSVVFMVILPIILASIVLVLRKSTPLYTLAQGCLDRVNTVMRENLLGIRVVKSMGLEDGQLERFSQANEELTDKSIRAQGVTFALLPVVTLMMNFAIVCVLWFGGQWVITGDLEVGKIIAFVNYLVQITNSLLFGVNLVVNISHAQASAERINEVLEAAPSIVEPENPEEPVDSSVEFRHVSLRYGAEGNEVLKDICLRVEAGQTVGIIGATGSGKSSLVNLIPRLYDATQGSVLVGGADVRAIGLKRLRGKIGIVMQESVLFSGTIEENLFFGGGLRREEELEQAVDDAQAGFIRDMPRRFKSPVEQRGKNFSGGQKQRLSIARTLLQEPDILILDDSSSALDFETESHLRLSLTERMHGRTTIIIAQRISAIRHADQIFVLDRGHISANGTHEELLRNDDIYRGIVRSQLGEGALSYAV
ncbi:MAG: ABC transporter ATP-binding protein [Ethanoligenens sp.]